MPGAVLRRVLSLSLDQRERTLWLNNNCNNNNSYCSLHFVLGIIIPV